MNSLAQQQEQKQSQAITLAPQLQHSLKILQVPATELRTSILEELQANPLLEELATNSISINEYEDNRPEDETTQENEANFDKDDFSILEQMAKDLGEQYDAEDAGTQYTSEDANRREYFMNSLTESISLQQHLIEQAELADASGQEHETLLYLIGSLDDNGFLIESISEIATTLRTTHDVVEKAIAILKSFDPPGIGTKGLQDCLATQLELKGQNDSVAARIVRDYFQLLTRRRIPELAQRLETSIEIVQEAIKEIARLDPAPGRRFKQDSNAVIEPDVTVYKDEYDEWQIELNNDYIPRLRISNAYKEMLARGNLSKQEREFMIERMRSGKFLINSIEQRQQTIKLITKEILKTQQDFFESGITKLRPMIMDSIAQTIGIHETTVSRAVANKYMRTPQGVFPFKYFFTTGYTSEEGESVSNKTVKDRIKQIIADETVTKPLSDQAIVNRLAQENIKIARRTVAKYREELGILPTHLRRLY
jgi:RNA polymerase sigma-54 factor